MKDDTILRLFYKKWIGSDPQYPKWHQLKPYTIKYIKNTLSYQAFYIKTHKNLICMKIVKSLRIKKLLKKLTRANKALS